MKIVVNGATKEVAGRTSISGYLAASGIDPAVIVIEYNRAILESAKWEETVLQDGDSLEILAFVGGG